MVRTGKLKKKGKTPIWRDAQISFSMNMYGVMDNDGSLSSTKHAADKPMNSLLLVSSLFSSWDAECEPYPVLSSVRIIIAQ